MGMFDYVKYKAPCPKCGVELTEWQSKDGEGLLDVLEPWQVNHFYTKCDNCGAWINAEVQHKMIDIVLKEGK